ncbi:DUF5704 domain-containing protein [Paenibacillus chitinolyticus]|uniref:DUF5704 domain-containing protein n=1 Tax=Paenibacillus chitinolyticus TaxID=79263 RepID=UPI00366DB86F
MKIKLLVYVSLFFIFNMCLFLLAQEAMAVEPPKSQKGSNSKEILSDRITAKPGVYWYQLDNGKFRADYSSGQKQKDVEWNKDCDNPFPLNSTMEDDVDLSRWKPQKWSYLGRSIQSDKVDNIRLHVVIYHDALSYEPVIPGSKPDIINDSYALLNTYTGVDYIESDYKEFMKRPNGCSKVVVMYETPVDITWAGDIYEEKEITVTPDSTISVGQKIQLQANVKTKDWGASDWGKEYDVATRTTETTWKSEDETIATVNASGQVLGKKAGKVKVRAIWDNGDYRISDATEITVTTDPGLVINLPQPEFCTSDSSIQQAEAVLTKPDGASWPLQKHDKLTWTSSNPSIAAIDQTGKITLKAVIGTTEITAHFKDDLQHLDEKKSVTLTVKDCGSSGGGNPGTGSPQPPGGTNGCNPVINPPSKGLTQSGYTMDPQASGMLRADRRGAETFNVLEGIPTSESLYANVQSLHYLFQNKFTNMTGEVTYSVPVTKTYVWTVPVPPPGVPIPMSQTVTQTMTVKRPYGYWQIDNLEIYRPEQARLSNYALGGYGGSVTLDAKNYTPPVITSTNKDDVSSHVQPSNCNSVNLGTGGGPPMNETGVFQAAAEAAVGANKVSNDLLVFKGITLMDNRIHDAAAPVPEPIPEPARIGPDTFYGTGYMISKTLANRQAQPTTGTIAYTLLPGNIKGGADKTFDIPGINPVTVHTPVIMVPSVSDDQAHNQKTTPAYDRSALILDRPFSVTVPTTGPHRGIPGYGIRDYAKYMRQKQVWFPFDTYDAAMKFIPKHTWIDIPVGQLSTTFYMPVWVDEGPYSVLFRSIAENAPASFTTEPQANLNLTNHVATDTVPVDVIGRLYDFKVTDIADFNWENVFRTAKGSAAHTGTKYWIGEKDIDGHPRPTGYPFILPIHPGSHPEAGYKNISVKTGYHIKFDLKTKGNMFGFDDGVRITPAFYFVSNEGGKRQPVDLYYHADNKPFVRIGSPQDQEKRFVVLNDRLRNLSALELEQTAGYLFDQDPGSFTNRAEFTADYIKKAAKPTWVGTYHWLILSRQVRTFIGETQNIPAGVDRARALASDQKWYGEYSLPAAVYAVPKGTDLAVYGRKQTLDDRSPVFLRNGYIVVNFNIESIRGGDVNKPYLQYIHGPLNNQWQKEGGVGSVTSTKGQSFPVMDGDVVFYHGDLSSYDDFSSNGTH